jgi:hypothetical protein
MGIKQSANIIYSKEQIWLSAVSWQAHASEFFKSFESLISTLAAWMQFNGLYILCLPNESRGIMVDLMHSFKAYTHILEFLEKRNRPKILNGKIHIVDNEQEKSIACAILNEFDVYGELEKEFNTVISCYVALFNSLAEIKYTSSYANNLMQSKNIDLIDKLLLAIQNCQIKWVGLHNAEFKHLKSLKDWIVLNKNAHTLNVHATVQDILSRAQGPLPTITPDQYTSAHPKRLFLEHTSAFWKFCNAVKCGIAEHESIIRQLNNESNENKAVLKVQLQDRTDYNQKHFREFPKELQIFIQNICKSFSLFPDELKSRFESSQPTRLARLDEDSSSTLTCENSKPLCSQCRRKIKEGNEAGLPTYVDIQNTPPAPVPRPPKNQRPRYIRPNKDLYKPSAPVLKPAPPIPIRRESTLNF